MEGCARFVTAALRTYVCTQGQVLHDLYNKAYTPWEWHRPIMEESVRLGMDFFTSPFDDTAVDFLETLNVPAYKVSSIQS